MHNDLTLHKEHKNWLKQLDFYENEIDFFFNQLDRVFDKNIADVTTVGHSKEYTDILRKKQNRILEMRKVISAHEKDIRLSREEDDDGPHEAMEETLISFISDFEKMKKNFRRFASRND